MTSSTFGYCGLRLAFDISNEHVLNWSEYFGFEDDYKMVQSFLKNNPISKETEFDGIDTTGAKFTIVFFSSCDPEDYAKEYKLVTQWLELLNEKPVFNDDVDVFNNMLESLNEDENDIKIFENDPDTKVWKMFNKENYGFETHTEHLADIAKS